MLALNLHVYRNVAVLSLDSSWESLHKRGYRSILTKAPLNAPSTMLTLGLIGAPCCRDWVAGPSSTTI